MALVLAGVLAGQPGAIASGCRGRYGGSPAGPAGRDLEAGRSSSGLTGPMPPSRDEQFRLRDIALAAYAPTAVSSAGFGAVIPVLALRARDLGADVEPRGARRRLLGVGQLLTPARRRRRRPDR